jgi:hypothetical protein
MAVLLILGAAAMFGLLVLARAGDRARIMFS